MEDEGAVLGALGDRRVDALVDVFLGEILRACGSGGLTARDEVVRLLQIVGRVLRKVSFDASDEKQ